MSTGLTLEAFSAHLEAIHQHYLIRAQGLRDGQVTTGRYVLPAELAMSAEVSQEVRDIINMYAKDPTLAHMNDTADYVDVQTQEAKDGQITPDEFNARMDKRAHKCVVDFTDTQNDVKGRLKQCGQDHPDQMSNILSVFNEVSDFLLGDQAWQKVLGFVTDTVRSFQAWAGKVLGWFQSVTGGVVAFFNQLS